MTTREFVDEHWKFIEDIIREKLTDDEIEEVHLHFWVVACEWFQSLDAAEVFQRVIDSFDEETKNLFYREIAKETMKQTIEQLNRTYGTNTPIPDVDDLE